MGIRASRPQSKRVGTIRVAKPSLPAQLLGRGRCLPLEGLHSGAVVHLRGADRERLVWLPSPSPCWGQQGRGAHRGLLPLLADVRYSIMH